MNGRVVERVKLQNMSYCVIPRERTHDTEKDQAGTADTGEEDGDPIENLFSASNISRQTVDVSKPSFREKSEDVECRGAAADDYKEGLVPRWRYVSFLKPGSIDSQLTSNITNEHHTRLIVLIPRLPAMHPESQQCEQSSEPRSHREYGEEDIRAEKEMGNGRTLIKVDGTTGRFFGDL